MVGGDGGGEVRSGGGRRRPAREDDDRGCGGGRAKDAGGTEGEPAAALPQEPPAHTGTHAVPEPGWRHRLGQAAQEIPGGGERGGFLTEDGVGAETGVEGRHLPGGELAVEERRDVLGGVRGGEVVAGAGHRASRRWARRRRRIARPRWMRERTVPTGTPSCAEISS